MTHAHRWKNLRIELVETQYESMTAKSKTTEAHFFTQYGVNSSLSVKSTPSPENLRQLLSVWMNFSFSINETVHSLWKRLFASNNFHLNFKENQYTVEENVISSDSTGGYKISDMKCMKIVNNGVIPFSMPTGSILRKYNFKFPILQCGLFVVIFEFFKFAQKNGWNRERD